MSRYPSMILIWIILSIVLTLAIIGAFTFLNTDKLEGGTCGSVGGEWVQIGNKYHCMKIEYIEQKLEESQ